jgi:polygalacturonase
VDTPAINKAIDAAAAVGGGTVYFSAGTYLCFSFHLKSKVELLLDAGSTIIAADPPSRMAPRDSISRSRTNPGKTFRISVTIIGRIA